MAKKSGGGGFGRLLLGFCLGVAATIGGAYAWLQFGRPPASVRQAALPIERQLGVTPGQSHHEKRVPPFGISEDVFEDGAKVYRKRCASCHGVPGRDGSAHRQDSAAPQQLWKQTEGGGAVGVSDEEPGEIYAKIADGSRSNGMPAFAGTLSDTEIWQVTLLIKNAGTEIPDPVVRILGGR